MTIESYLAEFKSQMSSYDSSGLIDDLSVYNWVVSGLRKFGSNIMELQETIIEIKDKEGIVPDNYDQLHAAWLCDPVGYFVKGKPEEAQMTLQWTERTECREKWNSCDPCCMEEENKIITEKVYFNNTCVNYYYRCRPMLLCLGKSMLKKKCYAKCRNQVNSQNPNEIVIQGKTVQTNFPEGDIYMQFYGLPTDENGKVIIPDTSRGMLEQYIDYWVHKKFFEKLFKNSDDPNVSQKLSYYSNEEKAYLSLALTDTKFSKLTKKSFQKLARKNRSNVFKYECGWR